MKKKSVVETDDEANMGIAIRMFFFSFNFSIFLKAFIEKRNDVHCNKYCTEHETPECCLVGSG